MTGKALRHIGLRRAVRYLVWSVAYHWGYRLLCVSPARVVWLRIAGATIGPDSAVMSARFFNLDRGGARNLRAGRDVFIGDECLLDMAAPISLGDQVTLAERVTILTHTNVGYDDHPLQAEFPPVTAPVSIGAGAYIGAGAIILPGVSIGPRTVVGAGAVVTRSLEGGIVAMGAPARPTRMLKAKDRSA